MAERDIEVGVIVERRKLRSPWADYSWAPRTVLAGAPALPAGTPIIDEEERSLYYAGPYRLHLDSSETTHYRNNLGSGRPMLWVAIRQLGELECEVIGVTADPYRGEAMTEGLDAVVEAVPMPANVLSIIDVFCQAFHIEQPFIKRERTRADPEALARRRPAAQGSLARSGG